MNTISYMIIRFESPKIKKTWILKEQLFLFVKTHP